VPQLSGKFRRALLCPKLTWASGKYYGLAAAVGKIGAYVGSWVFPEIGKLAGTDETKAGQYQFYVGASLSIFAAFLACFLPELHQDVVADEDTRFRAYLRENGYDTGLMGTGELLSTERLSEEGAEKEKVYGKDTGLP